VRYFHHGVGQGLFSSGVLTVGSSRFAWVHDCGSSSTGGAALIARGHRRLDRELPLQGARRRLDLLAVSHFDQDHISGIADLVGRYEIGAVLLPYSPLWQRLVAGFEEGGDPDLMRFCIDPVAYLTSIDGARIERIILVGPDGEAPASRLPAGKWAPESGEDLTGPTSLPPWRGGGDEPMASHPTARIEVLPNGAPLRLLDLWEFVPFADPVHAPARRSRFEREVVSRVAALTGAKGAATRRSALSALKAFFDKTFGGGPKARNRISLSLYAGPIDPPLQVRLHARLIGGGAASRTLGAPQTDGRIGQLLTGDADLSSDAAFKRFARAFGRRTRLRRIGVFQVMHHGARGNSHDDAPKVINPVWSVFSSDPGRKRPHPHSEIWSLYKAHGRVQVDTKRTLVVTAAFTPGTTTLRRWLLAGRLPLTL